MIKVVATDKDEPNNYNSDIRYSIINQEPKLPSDNMFVINPVNGIIRVNAGGLDREVRPLKQIFDVFVLLSAVVICVSYRDHLPALLWLELFSFIEIVCMFEYSHISARYSL